MNNNLDQFSDEELNLVTDYLVTSAKKRFNYEDFKNELSHFDEDFIKNNILLAIIGGKTLDESNEMISAKLFSDFLLSGFMTNKEDVEKLISKKETELSLEILASKIAMDSLQNGTHPTIVIQQISQLL